MLDRLQTVTDRKEAGNSGKSGFGLGVLTGIFGVAVGAAALFAIKYKQQKKTETVFIDVPLNGEKEEPDFPEPLSREPEEDPTLPDLVLTEPVEETTLPDLAWTEPEE